MDYRIGTRIRKLRENQSFTREELAEKTEISPKFLYEIEAGKKGFSAEVLGRIAKVLNASCDYIMTGETTEKSEHQNMICVLELVDTKHKSKINEILKILSDMF